MTVTVKQIGGSLAVIMPNSVAKELNLVEGTKLDFSSETNSFTMRRKGRRPRRPMAELLAGIDPEAYKRHNAEFDADGPVGKEIW